ncbi:MarR family transcriptional regulator [Actinobacteria bacterium YIM 96077]|uniref:MarR family transcriptional regulator n=1 Tax=Phytoactinopolyspora halophila TaxID=1981511 RepID=A0A329QWD5_9ACTN|nr:MarR family transcriptional regulator [Phytoactinopolyspora halophila]AYY12784.1 MarR family transcriptional regulator [Actinobacteria bacterium YIM 96077]RAW16423.1 MarR family transcriptional regulator [Phytoactinopolyspora halophila]
MTQRDRQEVHEELEAELLVLGRRLRRMAAVVARDVDDGLEAATYGLLGAFLDAGDIRAGDLAEHFGLDKSTVSRQVAQLESLGLVERVAVPEDRRARLIRITEAGRDRVHRLRAARAQWLFDALQPWPADDVDRFAELLGRLNEVLGRELSRVPR